MPHLTRLVQEYSERFQQLPDELDNSTRTDLLQKIFASFQAEVASSSGSEGEIIAGLTSLLTERGWPVDLWIIAAAVRPSPAYVPALCSLLSVRDAYLQHEWIVDILRRIRSPDAIDALRDACSFDIPADPGRWLAIMCLEALREIATPEAF